MVTVIIFFPLRYNDGERIPRQIFRDFETDVVADIGGYTEILGKARGEWADIDGDGTVYLDRSRIYEVALEIEELPLLFEAIHRAGRLMEQKTIYTKIDGKPYFYRIFRE